MGDLDWRVWLWLGAGLGAVVYVLAEWRNRRVGRFVNESARLLDLEDVGDGRFDGMLGDHRVTGTVVQASGRRGWLQLGTHVRLELEVAGTIARRIRLSWRRPGASAPVGTVPTGDPLFDRTIALEGDEAEVLAVFDAATRRGVLDLYVGGPFSFSDGRLTLFRAGLVEHPPLMEIVVRRLVSWANTLDLPLDALPERLASSALNDPEPNVRQRALRTLLGRFNSHAAAASVAHRALDDDDPMIRLWGAMALGEPKFDTIEQCVLSTTLPMPVRMEAFAYLVDHADAHRVMPLASRLLHLRSDEVARALADCLWRVEHAAVPGMLVRLMLDATDPATAIASAQGIGRCGTVDEVPSLAAVAETRTHGAELRSAARTAVAQIQARLQGAAAGQLTVAASGLQAGAMALAGWPEDDGGAVGDGDSDET